jgi:hypothetical protein
MQDPTTHVRVFFSTLLQPRALGLKKPSGKKKKKSFSILPSRNDTKPRPAREKEKTHQKKKKRGEKINRENPFFWPYPRNCNPQQ